MPTAGAFGARVKRVEDPRFLLGKAQYLSDMQLPGQLSVAFVRSSHAHARIKSIDASKAVALKGVRRVIIGKEAEKLCKPIRVEVDPQKFPGKFKACSFDIIAINKVCFVGDLIAAVVATDRYVAEDAAELVEVDYEPLPVVLDP